MIVTARQLDDLHKLAGSNGHVTLPYRARLTPLAVDFVRARKLQVGYSDVAPAREGAGPGNAAAASSLASSRLNSPSAAQTPGSFLWWCDGPCGPAKAAVVQEEKQSNLAALSTPQDAKQIVAALKLLASSVKSGSAAGGILLVQNGAAAMVFANRCPSLRAVLGTCLEAVEQGVQQLAANVLVIEYPYKTLQQVRNMLSRFVKAQRSMNEDVKRNLQELASCG